MTDANTEVPKKSNKKKVLAIVSAILILVLGVNHFTVRVGYTSVDVAVTDSTIVVTPMVDTTIVVAPAVDTTKIDTAK